ncbi:hypothetical protein SEA_LYELL_83 [Microbacterium phage Lyell]|nr:hypothetical protein SEA_LYELL_83 [Microbacterium phage Lyell]
MLVRANLEDLGTITRLLGVRVHTSERAPETGAIFDVTSDTIIVHPDEEHMVWASIGEVEYAFDMLDRTVKRQIDRHARHAEEKLRVKTPGEIQNEVRDVLAGHRFLMQE